MTVRLSAALAALLTLAGCASAPQGSIVTVSVTNAAPTQRPRRTRAEVAAIAARQRPVSEIQEAVVAGARDLIGRSEIVVRGRRFNMDCSGVVSAAYYAAGIDLTKEFNRYRGNGVSRIYQTLDRRDLLYDSKIPVPGDIIFWDNTYDRNGDGKWNDLLTHMGVVVSIGEDGRVEYVHENYRKGVVIEYMNLLSPDVNTRIVRGETIMVNSAMRMKGQVDRPEWLSSHLYKILGKGYELK